MSQVTHPREVCWHPLHQLWHFLASVSLQHNPNSPYFSLLLKWQMEPVSHLLVGTRKLVHLLTGIVLGQEFHLQPRVKCLLSTLKFETCTRVACVLFTPHPFRWSGEPGFSFSTMKLQSNLLWAVLSWSCRYDLLASMNLNTQVGKS